MIRLARIDDLPAITRVRTSVRENHLSVEQMAERGITEATIAAAMRSGNIVAWISESLGNIAAFAMVEPATGKLFALFTDPSHAGYGHGEKLLMEAENHLRAAGCRNITLDTGEGTSAVGFYARRGFIVTAMRDGDVFMAKRIS